MQGGSAVNRGDSGGFVPGTLPHPSVFPSEHPRTAGTENKGMTGDGGPSQGNAGKKVCAVQCTIRTFRRAQYSAACCKAAEEKRNQPLDSNINVKREETFDDGGAE